MSEQRLAGWAASSQNPTEVSNRIKGLVLTFSSVIIFFAANFLGINLSANDMVDIASQLGAIAGAVWTIYGAGLWLVSKFAKQ